mmetsp:Transcript_26702/g.47528  ORF Transcript_26702/g.47528 Transcript_26702/m.47528 type:complete len:237 (-) Transcript_26702:339-1049(-)
MVRGGSSGADRRSAATTSAGTALRRSGRERCGVILGLLKRGLNEAGSVDVIGMVVVVLSHGLTSAARRGTRVLAALSASRYTDTLARMSFQPQGSLTRIAGLVIARPGAIRCSERSISSRCACMASVSATSRACRSCVDDVASFGIHFRPAVHRWLFECGEARVIPVIRDEQSDTPTPRGVAPPHGATHDAAASASAISALARSAKFFSSWRSMTPPRVSLHRAARLERHVSRRRA